MLAQPRQIYLPSRSQFASATGMPFLEYFTGLVGYPGVLNRSYSLICMARCLYPLIILRFWKCSGVGQQLRLQLKKTLLIYWAS